MNILMVKYLTVSLLSFLRQNLTRKISVLKQTCIFNGKVSQQYFKGWPSRRRRSYTVGNIGAGIWGVIAVLGSNFPFTLLPLIFQSPSLQLSLSSSVYPHLPNYTEARKPFLVDHTYPMPHLGFLRQGLEPGTG